MTNYQLYLTNISEKLTNYVLMRTTMKRDQMPLETNKQTINNKTTTFTSQNLQTFLFSNYLGIPMIQVCLRNNHLLFVR